MRSLRSTTVALTLAAALPACSEEAVPPPRAPSATPTVSIAAPPPEVVDEALVARLRADSPSALAEAAQAIAAGGNALTRRAASVRLVAEAQAVAAPAWREAKRPWLAEINRKSHLEPSPAQFEAQLDLYRNEVLARLLAAMEVVGGPEVVAYGLTIAEAEAAPVVLRKAAVAVLVRHADRRDPALRARCEAAWERVKGLPDTPPAPKGGGSVSNAAQVVAGMAAGFRRCYNAGLQADPAMKGSVRVTAKIGADGTVTSAVPSGSGLSPAVVSCVVARVSQAVFAPPEGGGATIVIPVTFTTD